jgi:hypothetical protein
MMERALAGLKMEEITPESAEQADEFADFL